MVIIEREVIVEVPHRISGFFEIVDELHGRKIKDPEKIGSRGAGFNLNAVGITKIQVEKVYESKRSKVNIFINNEKVNRKAETTYYIYNYIRNFIKKSVKFNIFHNFDLPVGCGYGASGSGALGAIFGLDYLINLNLSNREKGRIAHIAEVVNGTGLGTVCGLLRGGLCVLREPGYPCVSERIEVPDNYIIICASFGMIHTKSILTDPVLNLKIKKAGRNALEKLIQNRNIKTFIKASNEFVKETEILDILNLYEIKELINSLNKLNILGSSMNQLGRAVYVICKKENISKVVDIFNSYKPEVKIYNLLINNNGPRILSK
ncbi:MAG: pantoate kinase [Promethearchaeota archaeon]